jgi:hypothetical protein
MASRIRPFSGEDLPTFILADGDVRIWLSGGFGVAGSPSRMRRWWFPLTGLRNFSKCPSISSIRSRSDWVGICAARRSWHYPTVQGYPWRRECAGLSPRSLNKSDRTLLVLHRSASDGCEKRSTGFNLAKKADVLVTGHWDWSWKRDMRGNGSSQPTDPCKLFIM